MSRRLDGLATRVPGSGRIVFRVSLYRLRVELLIIKTIHHWSGVLIGFLCATSVSLWLFRSAPYNNHRDTEDTEVAPRRNWKLRPTSIVRNLLLCFLCLFAANQTLLPVPVLSARASGDRASRYAPPPGRAREWRGRSRGASQPTPSDLALATSRVDSFEYVVV